MSEESSVTYYKKTMKDLKAHERYKTLSEDEKNKMQKYGCEKHKDLQENKRKGYWSVEKKYKNGNIKPIHK